jgi:superfamily II DNA or RNA helicase
LIINTAKDLISAGRKPLILFREHAHGEILADLLPADVRCEYVTGRDTRARRDEIRENFKNGLVDLILASVVYDQGVDLPALDALIPADSGKSTAKALQRIGRAIRGHPGKKDAYVAEFFDQAHYVREHSYARFEIYQTEPEFKIKCGEQMSQFIKKRGW